MMELLLLQNQHMSRIRASNKLNAGEECIKAYIKVTPSTFAIPAFNQGYICMEHRQSIPNEVHVALSTAEMKQSRLQF